MIGAIALIAKLLMPVASVLLHIVRAEFDDHRLGLELRADRLDPPGPVEVGPLGSGACTIPSRA